MTKYIAFLRAINVGKRRIKMDALRKHIEPLGFNNVETYIASGNVIFETDETDTPTIETRIERHLHESLGYEVNTFARTAAEIRAISQYQPFDTTLQHTLYIGFLKQEPSAKAQEALMAQQSDIDFFHIHECTFYWLCHKTISQSRFSAAKLEKIIKMPTTLRNATTIEKLTAIVNS